MTTTKLQLALKRRRWRDQDAQVVLAAYAASGQSMAAFSREHGVQAERLRRWPARLQRDGRVDVEPELATDAPVLLPVRVRGALAPPVLDVVVGPATVRVPHAFDPDHLVRVVQALAAPC